MGVMLLPTLFIRLHAAATAVTDVDADAARG